MNIDFLRRHAEEMQDVANDTQLRHQANPRDFWLKAAAKNQHQAALDAAHQLNLALAQAAGELVDIRFMGPKADGSILLDAFIRIADQLSKAWKTAAHRLRHGVTANRVDADIPDNLNIRLAGLASGSTHVYLTGNSMEDLTGTNLFRDTLAQTFRVLESNNDDFYDAIDAIGGASARHLKEAMRLIDVYGFSAEMSWFELHHKHCWRGTSDELVRIRTLLDAVSETTTYLEIIDGYVSTISDSGKLDIRTNGGRVRVRYPVDLTPAVQKLAIATPARLQVQTTKYTDPVTQRDIIKRQLIGPVKE